MLTVLSVTAGILYNSWPLAHWLNPVVSKSSLASGLEAVNQPYNWLFILCDILSSLLVIFICLLLYRRYRNKELYRSIYFSFIFAILFGICTIVDALLPLRCVQGIRTCPSFTSDHQLLAHGVFSILASAFLFISLLILWFYNKKSVLIDIFLLGYILFGVISFAEAIFPGKNGNS